MVTFKRKKLCHGLNTRALFRWSVYSNRLETALQSWESPWCYRFVKHPTSRPLPHTGSSWHWKNGVCAGGSRRRGAPGLQSGSVPLASQSAKAERVGRPPSRSGGGRPNADPEKSHPKALNHLPRLTSRQLPSAPPTSTLDAGPHPSRTRGPHTRRNSAATSAGTLAPPHASDQPPGAPGLLASGSGPCACAPRPARGGAGRTLSGGRGGAGPHFRGLGRVSVGRGLRAASGVGAGLPPRAALGAHPGVGGAPWRFWGGGRKGEYYWIEWCWECGFCADRQAGQNGFRGKFRCFFSLQKAKAL